MLFRSLPLALHPDMCPCAGFRRRFNRRAAGSIVSPELDRGYCPGHLHTESNRAPVAPALADMSGSRTRLVAQQRGLEPPIPLSGHPPSKRADYRYRTAACGPGGRANPAARADTREKREKPHFCGWQRQMGSNHHPPGQSRMPCRLSYTALSAWVGQGEPGWERPDLYPDQAQTKERRNCAA